MSDIGQLVKHGKKRGYLYKQELLDALPPNVTEQEQIDDIIAMLIDMGIEVREK